MPVTKKKRQRLDSRKKRLYDHRQKKKGHKIKEKKAIDEDIKRQKFAEEEEENKKIQEKFEAKKKLKELEQEKIEKRQQIKETFKSVMIDDKDLPQFEDSKDQAQDEIEELQALNELSISEIATQQISVNKLIKRIVGGEGTIKDCTKLILICHDLQTGKISSDGNEWIKAIKNAQEFYSFMVGLLPEYIAQISQASQYANSLKKIKQQKKNAKVVADPIPCTVSLENRALIAKYLTLLPHLFNDIENKEEITLDIGSLTALVVSIQSEKLIASVLSSVLKLTEKDDSADELIISFTKVKVVSHPKSLEHLLTAILSMINTLEQLESFEEYAKKIMKVVASKMSKNVKDSCISFIISFAKKLKHKMKKGRAEINDQLLEDIISEKSLASIRFLIKFIKMADTEFKIEEINEGYEVLLDLLTSVLHFVGHEITIYAPFTMSVIRLYNTALHELQASLDETRESTTLSISTFIMLMLERNDSYFTKKPKGGPEIEPLSSAKLSDAGLEHTKTVGMIFNQLMNGLKISLALYYNKGKNIGFPEFSVPIRSRLSSLKDEYKEMEENINMKNNQSDNKDSRNKIYSSRIQRIGKLIEEIDKTANATYSVRNDYAKSVTVDTHSMDKMIEYCSMGYGQEHPQLYKESIKMISGKTS